MANRVRFPGGARLNPRGEFEVYLGGGHDEYDRPLPKYPIDSMELMEMIREYYDFLMSDDKTRRIGTVIAKKTIIRKSKRPMARFRMPDGTVVVLFKGKGQFASMAYELPFLVEDNESQQALMNDLYSRCETIADLERLEEEYAYND